MSTTLRSTMARCSCGSMSTGVRCCPMAFTADSTTPKGNRRVKIPNVGELAHEYVIGGIHDVTEARVEVVAQWNGHRYTAKSVSVFTLPGTDTAVSPDMLRDVSIDDLIRTALSVLLVDLIGVIGSRPDASEGPTDENLRVVSIIYRRAFVLGDAPTKAVTQGLGLNPNTAARWVMKAREKGYLPPTEKGKAGA